MDEIILRLAIGLPGFLLAIVLHEWAHAYVAYKFGDDTAKVAGRMTIHLPAHIDIFGTIVFPIVGALMGGIMFGWAQPVPVDARRFKNYRHGIFWVSFAGPLMNIILGSVSAFGVALMITQVDQNSYLYGPFLQMLQQSVYINFMLAAFNLIPFPPLDGSKMVSSFLNYNDMVRYEALQRYSFIFFIILLFTRVIHYVLTPALMFGEFLMKTFYQVLI